MKSVKIIVIGVIVIVSFIAGFFVGRSGRAEHSVPVTAKPFKCGYCNASFDERTQLEWHIKNTHNHYECPYCGNDTYFASREELNRHIMDKHRSDEI